MSESSFASISPYGVRALAAAANDPQVLVSTTLDILRKGIGDSQTLLELLNDFELEDVDQRSEFPLLQACRALILINHFSDTRSDDNRALIEKLVATSTTLQTLFCRIFNLPEHVQSVSIRFLEFGTTSIILKASSTEHGPIVVKLLKPRYWDNERLVRRTAEYYRKYNDATQWSPRVHAGDIHWVIMDFVDGVTFYDWVAAHKKLDARGYYERLLHIFAKLIDSLEEASRKHNLSHLDLNPKNILIEERPGFSDAVWLIDFGTNYAVTDRVGGPGQYADIIAAVEAFIPPETFHGRLEYSPISDAYSIGMLLIASLAPEEFSRDSLGNSLIELWRRSPGLAEYAEQLVERSPEHRLVGYDWTDWTIFPQLRANLDRSMKFFMDVELVSAEEEPRLRNVWRAALGIWMSHVSNVRLRGQWLPRERTLREPPVRYFRTWASLSLFCHYLIVASFIMLTLIDFQKSNNGAVSVFLGRVFTYFPFDWFGGWYEHQHALPVHVGDFWGNLPGRLVCLSFSVVQTRYYLRVFSLVHANSRDDALCRWAEVVMRINSISFILPIGIALFVQPKLWPLCVAGGILPVVINNRLIAAVIARAHREGNQVFSTDQVQGTARFLKDFDLWWIMMFVYAIVVALFGLFIIRGYLKDELAYALIILVFNFFQIILIIIGQLGYEVRGGIKRLIFLDKRLVLLKQKLENSPKISKK